MNTLDKIKILYATLGWKVIYTSLFQKIGVVTICSLSMLVLTSTLLSPNGSIDVAVNSLTESYEEFDLIVESM